MKFAAKHSESLLLYT